MTDQMHLALFHLPMGGQERGWTHPGSRPEELWGLDLPRWITQRAEAAKLDAVFFVDFIRMYDIGLYPQRGGGYEPISLMAALAASTSRIGLIGTISTSFFGPYDVARFMTSLDHLSGGRVGWNIVTSVAGEEHYGIDLPPKSERYIRAAEHVSACKALWDAWGDDAVVMDRQSGTWADVEQCGPIDFEGKYFKVAGPLMAHRSPQGWPVLAQAGQSPEGVEFAATHAEMIFTAQNDIERARTFRSTVRDKAAAHGRDPDSVKILPGFHPIVGRDEDEARDLAASVDALINFERGRQRLAADMVGARLDDLDLDEPIPLDRLLTPDEVSRMENARLFASRYQNYYTSVAEGKVTLREAIVDRERNNGHFGVTGSAVQVADQMEAWFRGGACDGFMFELPLNPGVLDNICDLLVPELQRRGIFRKEYTSSTLRGHLGLDRPVATDNPMVWDDQGRRRPAGKQVGILLTRRGVTVVTRDRSTTGHLAVER